MLKDISELLEAGVISKEVANSIETYYQDKKGSKNNWIFIIFGILGALLIGLGIILILAHNWDELPKAIRTVLAFLPLIVGQAICVFVIRKKMDNIVWRESSTTFLFLAIGACISLISQTYNIPGDLSSFLLTWMLLALPLIYIMKSSTASLLYLIGITAYSMEEGYDYYSTETYWFWLLLLAMLPYYFLMHKEKNQRNFMVLHNWLLPVSILLVMGAVETDSYLLPVLYCSLLSLFYLIGNLEFFSKQKTRNNGYKVVGFIGTIILLLIFSYEEFWEDFRGEEIKIDVVFWKSLIVSLAALALLFWQQKNKALKEIKPLSLAFIFFMIIYAIGYWSPIAAVLINLLVLVIGLLTLREGTKRNNLGILNMGVLILMSLIACRFFDYDLGFLLRGILFIILGLSFFAANYWMLKKRKRHAE